jgi:hypothetical protein
MIAPTLDRDTGLAAMVAAAQPGDHGVVADWIEDYLHLDDLAAVLRAGLDDPRLPGECERTGCYEFRYRRVDRLVLLAMAGYHVWEPVVAGQPLRAAPTGLVVCLCTPPEAVGGMRRWGRWFPATMTPPALTRLWDDLGKDLTEATESSER